jgi:RNA-directed DNA polymerase
MRDRLASIDVNKTLVRWALRKYKTLRGHKTIASKFMQDIARQSPDLFAHWRAGMVGVFT